MLSSRAEPDVSQSESDSDIEGLGLYDELKTLCNVIPESVSSPLDVLRYLHENRLQEVFPNFSVALRIALTVPVTVASAERSFSKLKLIKTYLRSTMTQDRLVGLATISSLKVTLSILSITPASCRHLQPRRQERCRFDLCACTVLLWKK